MKQIQKTELKKLNDQALCGGGQKKHERQKQQGKLTARERIELLLDQESFLEIDRLATSLLQSSALYTDGVITGFGKIEERKVALFAQDFSIKGGSLGKRHAEKICKIMDMAAKVGCPVIGLLDSGGARIDEGIHALAGYGEIFKRNVRYSGVIPQISLILGPCAGGAVYSPALTDIIGMTEQISHMFITGPQVVKQVLHEQVTKEELGGTKTHTAQSGVCHLTFEHEQECFERTRQLITYLPDNYLDQPPEITAEEELDQSPLSSIIPTKSNQAYDMKQIITIVTDSGSFFELQESFASNIITGFARINGTSVGIVANQPLVMAGTIDIDASCKASRFINLCNSFSIPLISFVDVPGFLPGIEQEQNGIIRHGAKLLYAYAQATIPLITIITRKAFGGAYIVMGSKELGADFNFSWPTGQIAVLGPQAARIILHTKQTMDLPPEEQKLSNQEFERRYEDELLTPLVAAQMGSIDAIIEPEQTRATIIQSLEISSSKITKMPRKKAGSCPL